jgi:hypothetical protein
VQNFVARSYFLVIEIYGALADSSYVHSIIMVVEEKISTFSLITREIGVKWFPV